MIVVYEISVEYSVDMEKEPYKNIESFDDKFIEGKVEVLKLFKEDLESGTLNEDDLKIRMVEIKDI